MTGESVLYDLQDGVATVRIDDGKRNALSPEVFAGIYRALDCAEADGAVVILTGREDVFSAGFDLKVMGKGGARAIGMLRAGYALTARVMAYPHPVIAACNGHVLAMGLFLALSADYVIGRRGDFRIAANEVALGLTMPRAAAAVLRHRLDPAAFQKAVTLSHYFDVEAALAAGIFDELAESAELLPRAQALAADYRKLDAAAHKASKRRIRRGVTRRIRLGIPLDLLDAAFVGLRRARSKKGPA